MPTSPSFLFFALALTSLALALHRHRPPPPPPASDSTPRSSTKQAKRLVHRPSSLLQDSAKPPTVMDGVGGHAKKNKGPAMLQMDGYVFKPFQEAQTPSRKMRGELEAEFYARVWSGEHPLREHQPGYFGVETLDDGKRYLVLEDLTFGFAQPCVLDLKMGRRSYDEDASPEKVAKEKAKYPPQEVVGFRFSGMRVFQPATGVSVESTREWCFSLLPDQISDALERFFFDGRNIRRGIIRSVVEQVSKIAKCMEEFPTWRMYGASLLICYDGADPEANVVARLIDFSHCYDIKDAGGKDYGFLHGLYFLLSSLNDILDRGRRNVTRRHSLVDSATRLISQHEAIDAIAAEALSEAGGEAGIQARISGSLLPPRTQTPPLARGKTSPSTVYVESESFALTQAAFALERDGFAATGDLLGNSTPSPTLPFPTTPTESSLAAAAEAYQDDPHLGPLFKRMMSGSMESLDTISQSGNLKRRGSAPHSRRSRSMEFKFEHEPGSAFLERDESSRGQEDGESPMAKKRNSPLKQTRSFHGRVPSDYSSEKYAKSSSLRKQSSRVLQQEQPKIIVATADYAEQPETSPTPPVPYVAAPPKFQVGGAHSNIKCSNGLVEKEETDPEHFNNEVQFYRAIQNDSFQRACPALIGVDEFRQPRVMVLEDITGLVKNDEDADEAESRIEFDCKDDHNECCSMATDGCGGSVSSVKKSVNVMDVKIGFRSFRNDAPNESKKAYFEKYAEFVEEVQPKEKVAIVWKALVGKASGPECLQRKLLGKRDYLAFRDATTTSLECGFRLTALNHSSFGVSVEESKTIDSEGLFAEILQRFLDSGQNGFDSELAAGFIEELQAIALAVHESELFAQFDFVGTSLLFVHRDGIPAVRWIDFANVTTPSCSEDGNGVMVGIEKLRMLLENAILRNQLAI